MEPSHGTPTGCGRGRPVDVELRRPHTYPTYTPEYVSAEGPNTNGMFAEPQWIDQPREANYFASPSGDHARPQYDSTPQANKEKKPFQLSPYAAEFVPRNFRPEAEVIEQSTTEPDSLPVLQLRAFLSEINMSPGKYDRKIRPLIDSLNSTVDDDDTMRAVVNVIFDESIRQQNLRYSGARLCKSICSGMDPSSNHLSFKEVLLKRCEQEFKRQKNLAQAEDGGEYLRGFAMFMAELYSQLDSVPQKTPLLGDNLPNLLKTIISFPTADNLKCACQILKLNGAFLEDNERSNSNATPEMDSLIFSLKNLANDQEYARNIRDIISSVTNLRESGWGRSGNTENTGFEPPPPSSDEPVMYGPDGKPMTPEELMFLQSQYASNLPLDADEYDVYDDNPGEEMPDEISEAYEVFLRENALRH
jgi:polyadenylate-binding protein-interacting protein 1